LVFSIEIAKIKIQIYPGQLNYPAIIYTLTHLYPSLTTVPLPHPDPLPPRGEGNIKIKKNFNNK